MELTQTQLAVVVTAVVIVLLALRSGRGLLRLAMLFVIAVVLTLGVEWLVFVTIRAFYPQVTGTGVFQGLADWAYLPPIVVGALVTILAWREGV